MSPVCRSTPRILRRDAFSADRTSAVTWWPRPMSCLTSSPPRKPVAPVTKYRDTRSNYTPLLHANFDFLGGLRHTIVQGHGTKSLEALDHILDEIVRMLDARREANERIRQSQCSPCFGRNRRMRHAGRMADQRLYTAQAFAKRKEPSGRDKRRDFVHRAVQLERHHATKPRVVHACDTRMRLERRGDLRRVLLMAQQPQLQCLEPTQRQPTVKRRRHRTGRVLQELD